LRKTRCRFQPCPPSYNRRKVAWLSSPICVPHICVSGGGQKLLLTIEKLRRYLFFKFGWCKPFTFAFCSRRYCSQACSAAADLKRMMLLLLVACFACFSVTLLMKKVKYDKEVVSLSRWPPFWVWRQVKMAKMLILFILDKKRSADDNRIVAGIDVPRGEQRGHVLPKFLELIVILCFERRFSQ